MIGRNASESDTYTDKDGKVKHIPKYKKLNTKAPNGEALPVKDFHTLWNAYALKTDGRFPIVITEGIIDAMLLKQELGSQLQVLSPVTTRINKSDIDNIVERLWNVGNVHIPIIFCNDTEANEQGVIGAVETAESLQAEWNKRVKAEHEAYRKAVEVAKENPDSEPPTEPKRPTLHLKITALPCPPELDKIDVADYIGLGHISELAYWIQSAQPLWYWRAKDRQDAGRFFDGKAFLPKRVSDEIRQSGRYFLHTSGNLYEYQKGVYRENENGIKSDIQTLLWEHATDAHVQNVIKFISTATYCHESKINTSEHINCLNGVLEIGTLDLHDHSPYNKSLIQIQAEWHAEAECPSIEKFLSQVLPQDSQNLIREAIGYTLMQSNRYEKAVLMIGTGSNGKSTLLNVIRALLGKENYSTKSLKMLADDKFASASLFGKLANICGDISTNALRDTSNLKQIISTDAIDGQRKHKDSFTFDNFATNFFSCNQLPATSDRTHGFYRRWIPLNFIYEVADKDKDPDLAQKLTTPEELSGLLRLSVEGIARLKKQRGFVMPESVNKQLAEYVLDNDSVLRFFRDEIDLDNPDVKTSRTEIYDAYKAYCEDQNVKPVSQPTFTKSVETNEYAIKIDNERPRKWQGIQINAYSEYLRNEV